MNSHSGFRKVLVIPSWYPTRANAVVGSFFQEQSALLQQRYDVRVLYGLDRPVTVRTALRDLRWFPRRGRARVRATADGTIGSPPPSVGFEYSHRSLNERDTIDAAKDSYLQMLQGIMAKGWKPDLLHAHCVDPAGIIAAHLSRKMDIPWVLTEHQVFILANYSTYRRGLMVEALQQAAVLVAVSQHQLRCIALHDIDRPMRVVGNLIDEKLFPLAKPSSKDPRFRILTVTYPHPLKDVTTFFRAIAHLLKLGHDDVEVLVIGNNSFHDSSAANTKYFEQLADEFGVKDVCRFLAHVPRAEMARQYAECDVFVSTSVAETFGVAVREAMATGKPVVCTSSGGVDDDLTPRNGVKVYIRDHEAIADALIGIKTGRLRFDAEEVRRLTVTRHGREPFLNQVSAIYEEAMDTKVTQTALRPK